jgi:hypothetical protein
MKSIEENVQKVRYTKAIFYEIVGLQFRKMYTGILFPDVYTFFTAERNPILACMCYTAVIFDYNSEQLS